MKIKYRNLLIIWVLIMCLSILCACADKNGNEFDDTPAKRGDLYTLQEAYDLGLITKTDLQNIAYYANYPNHDESFTPTPKNPEELSAETAHAIKQTYAYEIHQENENLTITPSAVDIRRYHGTYNNCVVFMKGSWFQAFSEVEIGGITFLRYPVQEIYVWVSNEE